MIIQPTEPTPWAKMLGISELGLYDSAKKTYTLTVFPPLSALNFFGTTHGGYLAGVFDDAFGMLAYFIYGVNAATTVEQRVRPLKMLRPSAKNQLVFEISLVGECQGLVYMKGAAKKAAEVVAEAESVWQLRKNRGK